MLKIVTCDDDHYFTKSLSSRICEFFKARNIDIIIENFYSGEELIQTDVLGIDILFLDIQMAQLNGIEVAEILRERNPNFYLIFMSALSEYALQGYRVKAFSYELKDQLDSRLLPCLDSLIGTMGLNKTKRDFDFISGKRTIFLEDILFLESDDHIVKFHIWGDDSGATPYLYTTINTLITSELSQSNIFVRIQRSYLVNMNFIRNLAYNTAYLTNGSSLPISSKKYADVRRQYFRFKGKL